VFPFKGLFGLFLPKTDQIIDEIFYEKIEKIFENPRNFDRERVPGIFESILNSNLVTDLEGCSERRESGQFRQGKSQPIEKNII